MADNTSPPGDPETGSTAAPDAAHSAEPCDGGHDSTTSAEAYLTAMEAQFRLLAAQGWPERHADGD